ncbi:MAG: chaperone DnaJ domain protein, curved DNA-binding protein [Candidatus Curtissbacteria bacterium GW2011_GWC1_44_33]|nr:MAG: chaperone DnaJ domain protein, curved DNA-binding protein [Candidatus Curtissbacteria bacterium GW2011_GWC1_44_33]
MEAIKGVTKEVVVQGRKRKIKIPGGVDEGSRINFGDFILSINVKPHEVFERDGDDIFVRVAIAYSLAILGGEIKVPTLDGDIKIRIRPGTQSGTMLRLREKGVPRLHGRGRGDEYVRINVLVPEKITREQRRIIEEMEEEGL